MQSVEDSSFTGQGGELEVPEVDARFTGIWIPPNPSQSNFPGDGLSDMEENEADWSPPNEQTQACGLIWTVPQTMVPQIGWPLSLFSPNVCQTYSSGSPKTNLLRLGHHLSFMTTWGAARR